MNWAKDGKKALLYIYDLNTEATYTYSSTLRPLFTLASMTFWFVDFDLCTIKAIFFCSIVILQNVAVMNGTH